MKLRLGILASGRGSNLQRLIDTMEDTESSFEIAVVISDKKEAQALKRAKDNNIPAEFINRQDYTAKSDFEKMILETIREHQCDLICLAGFMRILSPYFISNAGLRIINIHPSLLPAFPGLDAQKQALEYGVKYSGCTVHFVDEGVDTGPIILQAVVPVEEHDTEETLSQRILKEEHRLYPLAVELIAQGKLEIEGRKVKSSETVGL